MTTREHFEKKAKEAGYDDFLHWCDYYDYEKQPEIIVEWTDELLKGQSKDCGLLHSPDWNGKCFKCGEQVFQREDKH